MQGRRLLESALLLAVLLVLAVLLAITAQTQAAEEPGSPSADACGPIGSDTTWILADSPHVITCDVTVNAGVTLTIEPGVVVKFQGPGEDLIVDGRLLAQGTSGAPIAFTSYRDDAHGGDTNGDGTSTTPAPANWGGIVFTESSSGSVLQHTWVGYGGYGGVPYGRANVHLYTSDVTVQDNVITRSGERGLHVGAVDPAYPLELRANTFLTNTWWAVFDDTTGDSTDVLLVDNTSSGSPYNGYGTSGSISGTVTYSATEGFPFVVHDDLTVEEGSVLTLTPATVLKFESGLDDLIVNGRLLAQGTEGQPIVFTSLRDDAHCGDTNGDGTSTTPAPANWGGIVFTESSSGSVLQHTWVGYGGYGGVPYGRANVHLYTSDVTVRDNMITRSGVSGLHVGAVDPDHPLELRANTFLTNTWWAVFDDTTGDSTDVLLVDNTSSGSPYNGYGTSGSISGTVTYSATEGVPIVVHDDLTVEEGSVLTLTPATVLKFESGLDDLIVAGRLLAQGTEGQPIVFTSLRDDAHGGDANGDGTSTTPAPANWGGIVFTESSSGSVLQHAWVGYGGYGGVPYGRANVHLYTSDVIVRENTITASGEWGILVEGAAPHIEGNEIQDSWIGIRAANSGLPRLWGNEIHDNSQYGVYNADASLNVDARGNWWGAASGPYHPTTNPAGAGDRASDDVYYTPWIEEFAWLAPRAPVVHGVERLAWGVYGRDSSGMTVSAALRGSGDWQSLGDGLPPNGSLDWDTGAAANGAHDLRLQFYDGTPVLLAELTKHLLVLNDPGIEWHNGLVNNDETWAAGSLHLLTGDVIVARGHQVTVEAGAIVKAAEGQGLIVEDGATLQALGSAGLPIIFTSLADDTVSGDTNLDGGQSAPRPGDWRGLRLLGSGQADLNEHVELRYVQLTHAGTLGSDATWSGTYVHVVDGNLTIPSGVTLTIEPGAAVKFDEDLGITVQSGGQLFAEGTVAEPIVFTSLRDDTVAGDTNHDAGGTAPTAGDWRGVNVDGGQASLDHVSMSYGGGTPGGFWDDAAAALSTRNGGQVALSNSLIREVFFEGLIAWGSGQITASNTVIAAADRAVDADGSSTVRLTNCTLDDNRIGIWGHGGTLEIENTIIAHSLEAGVDNVLGSPLTLRYSDVWSEQGVNYRNHADQTGQDGNLSVDPAFKDREAGNYRLQYASPCIDAADGTVAPETDFMGAPRYDDPRSPNTGLPTASEAYADMGAYEFVETAESNIDLVVTHVAGPSAATAGGTATVSWTVANAGSEAAVGPWHDAIALGSSAYLTPTLLVADEVLVGQGIELGPGASVELLAEVRVPGGVVGEYHWYVDANARGEVFEGQNVDNNLGQSPAPVSLDVAELTVDGPGLDQQFTAAGEPHWFRFEKTADQTILVTLDSAASSGAVELYLGRLMPTRQDYEARSGEWNSPDASVLAAGEITSTYYLLAYPASLPGGASAFTIQASELDFSVGAVEPSTVGNAGLVSLEISGGQLVSGTQFSLVGAGGARVYAGRTSFVDASRAYATFDLAGFPVGPTDVVAERDSMAATAQDAVLVEEGGAEGFYAHLTGPSAVRLGRSGTWTITYGNDGPVDVPLPLLRFSVSGAEEMTLFDHTANWADSFVLLGMNEDSLLPTLGPGQETSISVEVLPGIAGSTVDAQLDYLSGQNAAQDSTPFDWDQIPAPPGADLVAWQAKLDSLGDQLGETVGEYYALLMEDLDELARHRMGYAYVVNVNGQWLFGPEPWGVPVVNVAPDVQVEGVVSGATPEGAGLAEYLTSPAWDNIQETYHVIICDEDYNKRRPEGDKNLFGVGTDYLDLRQLVYQDMRVPEDHVVELFDGVFHQEKDTMSKDDLLEAIKSMRGKADSDDNLVVWYSGHGKRDDKDKSYLLLNDGDVYASDLQAAFDYVGARHTYFIADACNSGGMTDINGTETKVVGLYSTAADKLSHSGESEGSYLIKELKSRLRQGQTLQQAFDGADKAIKDEFKKKPYDQQQDPVLHNPHEVDLNQKPWEDPSGWGQRLGWVIRNVPASVWARLFSWLVGSWDPNDKVGPAGSGEGAFVGFDPLLDYTIHFENQATATAPAQEVVITDQLDPDLDLSTLELVSLGFNDAVLDVPSGLDHFEGEAQVSSDPNPVRVSVALDPATGMLTWRMMSVDAITGELPEDPFAGFLPPNDDQKRGEGYVRFTVRAQAGLPAGTEIHNQAKIVFDVNEPIWTNVVTNTIGEPETVVHIYLPTVTHNVPR